MEEETVTLEDKMSVIVVLQSSVDPTIERGPLLWWETMWASSLFHQRPTDKKVHSNLKKRKEKALKIVVY